MLVSARVQRPKLDRLPITYQRGFSANVQLMIAYVINPGSTSTKLALAHIERGDNPELPGQLKVRLQRQEIVHQNLPDGSTDYETLTRELLAAVHEWPAPDAVVSRGGLLGNASASSYRVTADLAEYLLTHPHGEYTGNAGAALAYALAEHYHVPAYIIDPPSTDEMLPEATLTGLPGVKRRSVFNMLNARIVARRAAYEQGLRFQDARVVVAHLGGVVSITAFEGGRAIDTTGAQLDDGPFSPTRAGTLPLHALLDLAYRTPRPELETLLAKHSGFLALTGTADLRELERREKSEAKVRLAADAFAHQVARYLGAYSTALSGRPHALALTGGIARWESVVTRIERRVSWIAPLTVIPGELELEALAEGAGRILLGLEQSEDWSLSAGTPSSTTLAAGSLTSGPLTSGKDSF